MPSSAHLEGGGAVELGGVHGLGQHVGDVGDELLQEPAGFLQVGGVDDDLHQLGRKRSCSGPCQGCQFQEILA